MKKIIFVSGIHGVGKTTFSKKLGSIKKINYYSASDLIKKYNSQLTFKDKMIDDVHLNQSALISSIERNVIDTYFILDGHFTLLNKSNDIITIPLETFKELNPCKIILLTLNEREIKNRLDARNSNSISIEIIERLQKKEIEQAKIISKSINAELIELNGTENITKYFNNLKKG